MYPAGLILAAEVVLEIREEDEDDEIEELDVDVVAADVELLVDELLTG